MSALRSKIQQATKYFEINYAAVDVDAVVVVVIVAVVVTAVVVVDIREIFVVSINLNVDEVEPKTNDRPPQTNWPEFVASCQNLSFEDFIQDVQTSSIE